MVLEPKARNGNDQVTTPLNFLKNNPNNHRPTNHVDNGDDADTSNDDDSTTYHDQTTKRQNVTDITSDEYFTTGHEANRTSDFSELDDDFVKSINPEGEVIVDKPHISTKYHEKHEGNNALPIVVNPGDKRYKPTTQTDITQTNLENSVGDEIEDEEAVIKRINPDGQVVINNGKPGKVCITDYQHNVQA